MTYSWIQCLGVLSAVAVVACGEAPPSEKVETVSEALAAPGCPHLLWYNPTTGAVGAWLLSGETVTGVQMLDAQCSESAGCHPGNIVPWAEGEGQGTNPDWELFDVSGNTVWWWNRVSGQVATWVFDVNGHVTYPPAVTWTCDSASGCATSWSPIGVVSLKSPSCSGICFQTQGILWHNQNSGEVSIWLLSTDNRTVSGAVSLNDRCGSSNSCSLNWEARMTDDFDGDGNSDLLWTAADGTDRHSVWLIKDTSGAVKGTQSFTTGNRSGFPMISGDVNGDGYADIIENLPNGAYPSPDGIVPVFYMDGRGRTTRTGSFTWHNTDGNWLPVGLVSFPYPPPR